MDDAGDDLFAAVTELMKLERRVGVEQGDRLSSLHKQMLVKKTSTEQLILGHLEFIRSQQLQVRLTFLPACCSKADSSICSLDHIFQI